jgi:Phage tail tube protein
MAKSVGLIKVKIDGIDYGTLPDCEAELGGVTREPIYASGRTFLPETPVACRIRLGVVIKSDTDIETIRKIDGKVVEFETDVGITYTSANCSIAAPPTISNAGARFELIGEAAVKV